MPVCGTGRLESAMEEDGDFDQVETTFGFFDPQKSDCNGIAGFIPKYLKAERIDLSMIVCSQKLVGTCIKNVVAEDQKDKDQSLFGFTSVVNLGYFQEHHSVQEFVQWLISLNNASLNQIISSNLNETGLILDERAYGVPGELAPHLMRGLFEEIEWATEDAQTQEERDSYKFQYYILVKKGVKGEESIEFPNVEDDIFFKNSMLQIEFQTGGEEGDLQDLEYHRYVLVIPAESIINVRQQVNQIFGVDESQYANEGAI